MGGATQSIKSSATKKIPTSKGAGVTKNTPPVSVVTGRTRTTSRVDKKDTTAVGEKKKVAAVGKKQTVEKKVLPPRVKEVEKTEPSEVEITPPVQNELKEEIVPQEEKVKDEEENIPTEPTEPIPSEEPIAVAVKEEEEEEAEEEKEFDEDSFSKVDEGVVLENEDSVKEEERIIEHSISHVSSGSSATTDEHDAEVAAAMKVTSRKSSGTPSYFDRTQRFSPPTARPETPEVDQLRQRFETIIKTPTENPKTPPSKISPEFVARIKEMRPKGPAGSRVKSMVELFMDENLNKWEF
ncbi:hypothetical protein K501DRAFT_34690 [Backusella circina FSU 941]|nr:hypothetical protein K501DRAFT_34690 [Backusella circina FSU 941]